MSEMIIKNGHVFDAVSGLKGDVADVCIKDGKIVDKVSSSATVIDAAGKTVMAGAVDVHTHVAGPKVNLGRWSRPEDKFRLGERCSAKLNPNTHIEGGFSVPTVFKTGYEYARMGFAFLDEAAMPPLYARHVHEEIRDTPIQDQAALPVFGNNWFMFEYLKNDEIDNAAAYVAWILRQTKGYGIKCVNPGGSEAWGWGLNCMTVNDPVPYFEITPAEIIKGLIKTNEYLRLPHCVHLHSNNLGNPGNYTTTLDSLKIAEGIKPVNDFGRESVLHHTHLQFHAYGGTTWADFESKSKEIMDYINKQKNITFDTGNVTLDETTTMTADGPFEYHLSALNHLKWANVDVELETAAGVVPYIYGKNVKVCEMQWAIGLELALYSKDMMRTMITTDHPNAGPFTRYPRVYAWLMDKQYRDAQLDSFKWAEKVRAGTTLAEIDREISLFELSQMTRAAPAKVLGLKDFGGLAKGQNGNVAVYDINPDNMPKGLELEDKLSKCAYFIKDGVKVVEDGVVLEANPVTKETYWVDCKIPETKQVLHDINEKFLKYYSVNLGNYDVIHHYVPHPHVIEIEGY
ncbi:MAG TPA: formylmethanofuran dehydrogenase subunit A [Methanocorpusculum sp.]|nr:formylmethanofuran dehydrogenase subunit A [Methanocorpusculum sp.]